MKEFPAQFSLRYLGDPILTTPSYKVQMMTDLPVDLIPAMKRILAEQNGLGLAAQQVGSDARVALMRLGPSQQLLVAINLRITERSPATTLSTGEGCLSVQHKGLYFRTSLRRHEWVTIAYQDEQGAHHQRRLEGLDAILAQHECDHLNGKCIADGVSRQQRRQAKRIVAKSAG